MSHHSLQHVLAWDVLQDLGSQVDASEVKQSQPGLFSRQILGVDGAHKGLGSLSQRKHLHGKHEIAELSTLQTQL